MKTNELIKQHSRDFENELFLIRFSLFSHYWMDTFLIISFFSLSKKDVQTPVNLTTHVLAS